MAVCDVVSQRNTDFNLFARIQAALAFVPVNGVVDTFDTLLEGYAPATAQPIIDYFEDNFIGRLTRRHARRAPLLSLDVFSVEGWLAHFIPLCRVLIRHCGSSSNR